MYKQIALPGTIEHGLVTKCHPVGLGEVALSKKVKDVAKMNKTVTVSLGVVESECNVYAQKLAELKRRESELVQEILRDEQKQKEIIKGELQKRNELTKQIQEVHGSIRGEQYENMLVTLGWDKSIAKITPLKGDATIQAVYEAIPNHVLCILATLFPKMPPDRPEVSTLAIDEVLKLYISESAHSYQEYDMLVFVLEKVIKKLLDVAFLPLPSVTTVFLLAIWVNMLKTLSEVCFPTTFLSIQKIVAIALSVVAILMQVLNREGVVLGLVKNIYSGAVYAKDLVRNMPSDVKRWLMDTFHIKDTFLASMALNVETWNNSLGKAANITNLSMGKALDMLFTFRIGSTFVDYSLTGKGLDIKSLSDFWKRYGPLPQDLEQCNKLIELYTGGLYNKSPKIR